MELLAKIDREHAEHRRQDIQWQRQVEENIDARFTKQLQAAETQHSAQLATMTAQLDFLKSQQKWNYVLQFLLALLASIIVLIVYRFLPSPWPVQPQ
jgi:hypothetical protein